MPRHLIPIALAATLTHAAALSAQQPVAPQKTLDIYIADTEGGKAALYVAPSDHFQTRPVEELQLGFGGISGDFHAGATRRSWPCPSSTSGIASSSRSCPRRCAAPPSSPMAARRPRATPRHTRAA